MSEIAGEGVPEHDALEGVPVPAATARLFGHEAAWRALLDAERSGRLHHAWLLQGPRGIGKATLAFAFARHLLGGGLDGEPAIAPDDPVARQIAGGGHPGLVHIARPPAERGGGFRTQITVEEVRRLNRFFHTTAAAGQWRIAIVDPADDMNRNAANALLKILEEPPERSIFLIANHMPGRLLPTIRSRCRVLRLDPLPAPELRRALAAAAVPASPAELDAATALSEGSARTAITLVTSGGLEMEEGLRQLWTAPEPAWTAVQSLADALTAKGRETAYDLAWASLFQRLAEEAEGRLSSGDAAGARRLAALHAAEADKLREGLAYNIDRKQLFLGFFQRLADARAPARPT